MLTRSILGIAATGMALSAAAAPQPNIITVMVDDLGWNHISAPQPAMSTSHTATPTTDPLTRFTFSSSNPCINSCNAVFTRISWPRIAAPSRTAGRIIRKTGRISPTGPLFKSPAAAIIVFCHGLFEGSNQPGWHAQTCLCV